MGRFITPPTAADILLDKTPLGFGKYRGQSPDEIYEHDPSYLVWLFDTVKDKPTCSRGLRDSAADAAKEIKRSQYPNDEAFKPFNPLDPLEDLKF